jgi:hypothetical protein
MKIFTSVLKTLAVAAGMSLAATQADAKLVKPSGGSSSGNVVISKVFYAGSIRLNDAKPKNYMNHLYIELYNNSADTLDLKGMYIALGNSDSGAAAWTADAMATEHKDSAVVKQIFQLPTEDELRLDPGQSVVIAQCAIDHSEIAEGNVDLSSADFEVKSQNNAYKELHNDAVPELKVISTFGTTDFINFMNPGPMGIILLAADTNLENCPKTFGKGKTSGNEYTIVPLFKSIDCVDIVKQKTPSADDKRFSTNYDAGFTHTEDPGTFSGQAVVRKTAFVTSDGRTVLYDTNNSSVDFESTTDLSLRSYSRTPVGLTESTITIPESGYLPINIDKPFCGGKDVAFVYVNATNNAATTDMGYYTFPGDSLLLISGPWIAVGQPGEHVLRLSDSQGVMKTRSSGMSWCDEDSKTLTGSQKSRMIYKFQNEKDNVGFKRVEKNDEGLYNTATFSDGDRLYYALTTAIADKIAAANGATGSADLDFIAWHGVTPSDIKDEPLKGDLNGDGIVNALDIQLIINAAVAELTDPKYDLNGDGIVNALDIQTVINIASGTTAE